MVLTSSGAVLAQLLGLRRNSSTPGPQEEGGRLEERIPVPEVAGTATTRVAEGEVAPLVSSAPPPSIPYSMRLVMAMFWAGVMVGVAVSGVAAWRLYTVSMAEREERMVQELQEQEARMEQEKVDRFWLGLAMASVISVVAVVQSYRMKMQEREACAKNQQRLKCLLVERMSKKETAPAPEEESLHERLQCVVCLGAEREVGPLRRSKIFQFLSLCRISGSSCSIQSADTLQVILLDCGHVCSCRQCADTLLREDQLCPVCRAEIRTVKPAFIS